MRTFARLGGLLALSIASTACEGGGAVILNPGGPSASSVSPVSAAVNVPMPTPRAPFVSVGEFVPASFDVVITASRTVDLQGVTIHMIDGTNLGGPSVTIPQPQLAGQFVNTRIFAGTSRTFTFRPNLTPTRAPFAVGFDLAFVEMNGISHAVSVSKAWQ
jgi:hypothetical protein